eukprot:XP_002522293.2 uncharacterized protein LOC8267206 [Ricinus communis]
MPRINPPLSPPFNRRLILLFPIIHLIHGSLLQADGASAASSSYFGSYTQYKTIISLSHSLFTRVSNLRAARGDIAGASRAKGIADRLEKGFWGLAGSVGFDYVKNYSWRDLNYRELYGVVSDLNELASVLSELTQAESDMQRASLVARNYSNILRIAKSVLQRFLKVFHQSGALKEVVETVQREVVDGELLRDSLELGTNDLKVLLRISLWDVWNWWRGVERANLEFI